MTAHVPDLWNDADCASFSEPELLRYRSNLLGSDLRITNFGGGNTSAKLMAADPLTGDDTEVLWVKGSGGDLGSMALDGFATLYMSQLQSLKGLYRGIDHEDEMVGYLPHCTFDLNPRPASIDTPLHGYLPYAHVDHMHPDAVIAIATADDGERLTEEIFGGEVGWLPWQRPGFDLGLRLEEKARAEPELKGIILGGHGVINWGSSSKECYQTSLHIINVAAEHLAQRERKASVFFGGPRVDALSPADRRAFAAELLPSLRGKLSREERKVGHFDDRDEVLRFVNSQRAAELAAIGTSCPDHFLRTKIRPLFVDRASGGEGVEEVLDGLDAALEAYAADYAAYYERCKDPGSPPMRDPYPVVVLVPGVGMLTFAKNKTIARQAAEFYVNAIEVMRGSTLLTDYSGLSETEAFRIEYWALEEAKLRRMPPEKSLSRRVALVTGAAGAIGKATAARLLMEKCCVVLTDIDEVNLTATEQELAAEFGADQVRSVALDVTDERSVDAACSDAVVEFGGLDIVVCSAGLASSAAVEDTSLELWQRNMDVLATGYFLVARAAFRLMKKQATGGSLIFITSKNAMAASPQASAYCTAKAAELHLARCLALEGADHGIRVNSVNPDAVLRGSKIWDSEWRKARAEAYDIGTDELEEHYRKRSLLGESVFPEDIAEAVYFFAGDRSAKSTGNVLNVDAGHPGAFPR